MAEDTGTTGNVATGLAALVSKKSAEQGTGETGNENPAARGEGPTQAEAATQERSQEMSPEHSGEHIEHMGESLEETPVLEQVGHPPIVTDDDRIIYSSHPVHRFKLGPYEFEDGKMLLAPAEAEVFDKHMLTQPPQIRGMIRKMDHNEAAKRFAQISSRSKTGVDTTSGAIRPAPED